MTDEERQRRQAEVYAARAEYERLRATYERDTRDAIGSYRADDILELSQREEVEGEQEFRRGYLHGAREAVMHFYEMVRERRRSFNDTYSVLVDWHERDLVQWHRAAKTDKGNQTPPPDPRIPDKTK